MMLVEFKGFRDFKTDINKLSQNTIDKNNITNLKDVSEYLNEVEIKTKLLFNQKINDGIKFFRNFIKPYLNLKPIFEWAKGRMGLIYLSDIQDLSRITNNNDGSSEQTAIK